MALPSALTRSAADMPPAGSIDAAPPADDGSYRIVIDVIPDGTFLVGKDGDEEGMRPADSIKQALTHALEIFRADGQASAEAQFDAGFAGKDV